ncbi:MAG: phosphatidylserine decarboxylase family protein [Bacteroidales bacterium]|nr:phosphatidylserine decarboxylase family protein [Bacteroidales bacterium]
MIVFLIITGIVLVIHFLIPISIWLKLILYAGGMFLFGLVTLFFRNPARKVQKDNKTAISGADGKVVAIEEEYEKEYFKDKRIRISVFMSIWDVHINRYPVSGKVIYKNYSPGKYLIASHPKSSELNERTTVVVKTEDKQEILFRQIAGVVARKIVCFTQQNTKVEQGEEMGLIKFGSRFDIFLPLNSGIKVKIGDKVRGGITGIAELP